MRKDLTGNQYGYLTVVKFSGTDAWGKAEWECSCSCGNVIVTGVTRLNCGITKSCGCLRNEKNRLRNWKGCGEISMDFFSNIRRGAKGRKLIFDISIEYIWELFQNQNGKCALSGVDITPLSFKRGNIRATASLDRIDNTLGYIEGNVQWVHKHINISKHTYGNEEFIELCNRVAKLHPR